jgi:hypothetical protein
MEKKSFNWMQIKVFIHMLALAESSNKNVAHTKNISVYLKPKKCASPH